MFEEEEWWEWNQKIGWHNQPHLVIEQEDTTPIQNTVAAESIKFMFVNQQWVFTNV